MKKISLLLALIVCLVESCKEDDCGACFTPPQRFEFIVVDKTSGENLFSNGTFNPEDIVITDVLDDNEPVQFTFVSENDINLIQIFDIGWETEIVDLKIDIADQHIFNLKVDAERKTGDCCSYTEYNEVAVSGADFDLDNQTGLYTIKVE